MLRRESVAVRGDVSNSRYAEPEAEGVRPVWRTTDFPYFVWRTSSVGMFRYGSVCWMGEDWRDGRTVRGIDTPSVGHIA